jgi:hypothetical protein
MWLLDLGRSGDRRNCSCSGVGGALHDERKMAGKRTLFYSRCRRYVSFDGNGVDLGGCWSPGSSPGMIALER